MATEATGFAAVRAGSDSGLELSMQKLWLRGKLLPVGARLEVAHVFRCAEKKPVEAIYAFMLPRDAALRRFLISGDGFEAHSELREANEAAREYERGIEQGSLAALARSYRDGVVNLSVGNVQPGETVTVSLEILAGVEPHDDGFRFRFPFTLAPRYHSGAKAIEATRDSGEMELPPGEFGDLILPRWMKEPSSLHEIGFDIDLAMGDDIAEVWSPSHAIRARLGERGAACASLATGNDVPDRDLVLEAKYRETRTRVWAGAGEGSTRSFAAVIPSTSFGEKSSEARRVVIVLDRSGSMQGAPMAQARRAVEACIGALDAGDEFGLVAFDNQVESFAAKLVQATNEQRANARAFLSKIDARGGTELARGFQEAARLLARGGDALIFTDGQVAGTEDILGAARQSGIRLHCLGIGSASQDRFLTQLARETGGISRFVTGEERVDLPAVDLFASIGRPVAAGIGVRGGRVAPDPAEFVFAGTPLVVFGDTDGSGTIEVVWNGGTLEVSIGKGDAHISDTVRLLQGARLITDLEARYPNDGAEPVARRESERVAARLRALSAEYGLASREMSLVAVVERKGDRPGDIPKTTVVPVGMPKGIEFHSYFGALACADSAIMQFAAAPPPVAATPKDSATFSLRRAFLSKSDAPLASSEVKPPTTEDKLLSLAARLEADGGMPGRNEQDRIAASVAVLLAFVTHGHTRTSGAFRSHVARLITFLERARADARVQAAIDAATRGRPLAGDWLDVVDQQHLVLKKVKEAIEKRSA